mmetsp:Transcript_17145/g.25982  ORF Transcript_17145/g.25982 Transcript_17145/m.25982 type:complete len:355 (+) Transcript_17145:74-1138(+)
MMIFREALLSLILPQLALSWGSGNGNNNLDYTFYSDSYSRDWLSDGSYVSLKLEGCVWGYVYDSEESGCLEDSSEDGTTSWYMMSNCRRAQAAFSLYASESSGDCSSSNFKESFVTTIGVAEFINWLQEYDENSPFLADDDDDGGDGGWNLDELPECEESEYGYVGLGCNSDGTFSLNSYNDQYCLSSNGILDKLNSLNYKLKTYSKCQGLTNIGQDNDDGDDEGDGDVASLAQNLVYYATSCSTLDSNLCTNDSDMKNRMSSVSSGSLNPFSSGSSAVKSWSTKVKYGAGGLLLLASLVMFTGILFTNRRRRKALMQRKYRQSRRRSKSRSGKSRRSRSSRRSKSRARESSRD